MNSFPPNDHTNVQNGTAAPYHPQYHQAPGVSANVSRDLIGILLRRKRTIITTALVCAGVAALFAFTRERDYLSTAQILIDPRGVQVVDRDITPRNGSADGGVAIVESQMRVLTSNTVLSRVIESENLTADPEFTKGSGGLMGVVFNVLNALKGGSGYTDPKLKVLHKLQDRVRTSRPKRSYIISLDVKTKDPEKSARIANAIANIYLRSEAENRSGQAGRASDMLTSRLGEMKKQLNEAEEAAERFKVENNIVNSSGSLINEQGLTQSNQMLVRATGETSAALAKLEQIRQLQRSGELSQSLPEAVVSQTITRLRERYAAAKQRQQSLSAQLLPSHPRMQGIEAEVESARSAINAELRRIANVAKNEYDRALANQKQIEAQISKRKQSTFATNDALVRLRELQRDVDSKRAIYESFLNRARELGEQRRVDTSSARIVSPAVVPIDPSGLGGLLIVALGLIAGTGLGTILAFGGEAFAAGGHTSPNAPRPNAPRPGGSMRQWWSSTLNKGADRGFGDAAHPAASSPGYAPSASNSNDHVAEPVDPYPQAVQSASRQAAYVAPGMQAATSGFWRQNGFQHMAAQPDDVIAMPRDGQVDQTSTAPVDYVHDDQSVQSVAQELDTRVNTWTPPQNPTRPQVRSQPYSPPGARSFFQRNGAKHRARATEQSVSRTQTPQYDTFGAPLETEAETMPILASIPVQHAPSDNGLPAFVADNPTSDSARAVDKLLDSVRPNGPGNGIRTVMVTSPGNNHGKTTVALNLALAAARRGEKVLLIDGDLEAHSLSSIRLGDPDTGLASVIAGATRLQEALVLDRSRMIMTLPAGNIQRLFGAGPLTADRITDMVIRQLPDVGLIVIDGPVIGGATGTFTPLSECADVLFMVYRSSEIDDTIVQNSISKLNGQRAKCAGSVIVTEAA